MARVAPRRSLLAAAVVCAGCSGEGAPTAPPGAAPGPRAPAGATPIARVDTASALLDEGTAPARVVAPTRPKNRPSRPIDVTLKSDPPGALAAVDGRPIGTTPTFWAGESDGLEHEFTFTLKSHASARYRFVPVASGVLHVRLQPVPDEPPVEGLEPLIAPTFSPDPAPPPPAPALPTPAPPAPTPTPPPPHAP